MNSVSGNPHTRLLAIEHDLSQTAFMRSDGETVMPDHGELLAIMIALLTVEKTSLDRHPCNAVRLGAANLDAVAEFICQELPLFFQRATDLHGLRACLDWYEGLTITAIYEEQTDEHHA
jgi:hypothetical protein